MRRSTIKLHVISTKSVALRSSGRSPIKKAAQVTLAEIEKRAILAALKRNGGNRLAAARELAIGKTTLYRKLQEYARKAKKPKKRAAKKKAAKKRK